jgi:hypothetical protein
MGIIFFRLAGARLAAAFFPAAFFPALFFAVVLLAEVFFAEAFFTAPLRVAFLATTFRPDFFAADFFAGFLAADFFAGFLAAAFAIVSRPSQSSAFDANFRATQMHRRPYIRFDSTQELGERDSSANLPDYRIIARARTSRRSLSHAEASDA